MQNSTSEIWLAAIVGLIVGFVLAYALISLTKDSVKKQNAAKNELSRMKQQLEIQNEQLEKHFSETAVLFKNLVQDYQFLYKHLAKSSKQLLPQHNNGIFLQNFIIQEKPVANDNPPKDYVEGSSELFRNNK